MSGWASALALLVLAGAVAAIATAALVAAAWPVAERRLRRAEPGARGRAAWWAAAGPSLAAALLLAICLAPGALAAIGVRGDHCTAHPDHPHVCLAHRRMPLTPALAGVLAGAAAAIATGGARGAGRVLRGRRLQAALGLGVEGRLAPDAWRVASDRPFSVATGLLRPRILVSSALVRALSPSGLAAVLEHERAHVRRRDALVQLVARVLSWPHLPAARRRLLRAHRVACERACDEAAARRLGDRLGVAETIVAVERLASRRAGARHPAVLAFGEGAVAERVRALLAPAPPPARRVRTAWLVGLVVAALGAAEPVHHWTEHGLALLIAR